MSERYTRLERIGRGTMGDVWRAKDATTGDIVALKYLHVALADEPTYRERFAREVEIARRIDSPYVVKVLDSGEQEGRPYLVLEYVDGRTLREAIAADGAYPWPEARGLLIEVASGLAAIHDAGVLHRDLKPANVLLSSDGVVKIADFGIAKAGDLTALTGTVTVLGTPTYLAPEGPKDVRSDLYGLGVIAYELLAGVPPFTGDSHQAVILAHISTPPDLSPLPREARGLVGSLLAKNPDARPQTARAVLTALVPLGGDATAPRTASRAVPTPTAPSASLEQPETTPLPAAITPTPPPAPGTEERLSPPPRIPAASSDRTSPRRTGWVKPLAAVGVLGAATLAIGILMTSGGRSQLATEQAAELAAESVPAQSATPVVAFEGVCSETGSLPSPLTAPVLRRLRDGRVLAFPSNWEIAASTIPALFDPTAGSFSTTGEMAVPRRAPETFELEDGRVLIIGGWTGTSGDGRWGPGRYDTSVEIFDPATAGFTLVGSLPVDPDGMAEFDPTKGYDMVQDAGGPVAISPKDGGAIVIVVDPADLTIRILTPDFVEPANAAPLLLEDGRVLFVGPAKDRQVVPPPSFAEVVDLSTGVHRVTGELRTSRVNPDLFSLGGGRVLVMGGSVSMDDYALVTTVEIVDLGLGEVTAVAPMKTPRGDPRGYLLSDGYLLLWAGESDEFGSLMSAEVFDPRSRTFAEVPGQTDFVDRYRVVQLKDGRAMVFSDYQGEGPVIVDPRTLAASPIAGLPEQPYSWVVLPDGTFLASGNEEMPLSLFYPDTSSTRQLELPRRREQSSLALLADGSLLIVGGASFQGDTGWEIFSAAEICR